MRVIRAAQDMPAGAPGTARGAWSAVRPGFPSGRPRPQERLRRRQVAKGPARPGVQAVLDGSHPGVRHFLGKSVPLGRYPLTRPLVCPVGPRSHEW